MISLDSWFRQIFHSFQQQNWFTSKESRLEYENIVLKHDIFTWVQYSSNLICEVCLCVLSSISASYPYDIHSLEFIYSVSLFLFLCLMVKIRIYLCLRSMNCSIYLYLALTGIISVNDVCNCILKFFFPLLLTSIQFICICELLTTEYIHLKSLVSHNSMNNIRVLTFYLWIAI